MGKGQEKEWSDGVFTALSDLCQLCFRPLLGTWPVLENKLACSFPGWRTLIVQHIKDILAVQVQVFHCTGNVSESFAKDTLFFK